MPAASESAPELPRYADRPEWSDVIPIQQYENMNPLAPIFYTDACMCRLPFVAACAE